MDDRLLLLLLLLLREDAEEPELESSLLWDRRPFFFFFFFFFPFPFFFFFLLEDLFLSFLSFLECRLLLRLLPPRRSLPLLDPRLRDRPRPCGEGDRRLDPAPR